jgi:hypothetical protein
MNVYVLVEGEVGEKYVYRDWIPYVNPSLSYVSHISEISSNNFSIIAGMGYPNYHKVIDSAIEDIETYSMIDRLVIAIDSEDQSYTEKKREVEDLLSKHVLKIDVKIIVQHFCLETWALGNRTIIRKNHQCPVLAKYKRFYNVKQLDPEGLPGYPENDYNRAQFATLYLRRALNDRFRNLTYTKSNPGALLHPNYFKRVKERYEQTNHICSFNDFLVAFQ